MACAYCPECGWVGNSGICPECLGGDEERRGYIVYTIMDELPPKQGDSTKDD